jgi:outer membrane receptor protein involved in Fe transport
VVSGQNINTPQTTKQVKYQYRDDFSWSNELSGHRHDFKAGVSYVDEPTLGGDFTTGTSGQYTMLLNDPNGPVTDITFTGGFFGNETPIKQLGGYIQDDWYVSDSFTLNLGLRYDFKRRPSTSTSGPTRSGSSCRPTRASATLI